MSPELGAPNSLVEPIVFWLDGNDLPRNANAIIRLWRDRGARENDFTGADPGTSPSVSVESARTMAHFSQSTSLWLRDTAFARPPVLTLAIVCRSFSAGDPIVGFPTGFDLKNLPPPYWHWVFSQHATGRIDVTTGRDFIAGPLDGSWSWGRLGVFIYRMGLRDVFRDGKQLFAFDAPDVTSRVDYPPYRDQGIVLGGFQGDVAEVVAYEGTISDEEVQALSGYLRKKWQLDRL